MICDFHVHSTCSDGTVAPEALAEQACDAGVDCFALTDHDTVAGVEPCRARGLEIGVEVWAGVELSVSEDDGARQLHVLGLAIDPAEPGLAACLDELGRRRRERLERMVAHLAEAGVHLSADALLRDVGRGAVGRPHVARALVAAGHCTDEDDAFARYLRRGRCAYEPSAAFAADEAIRTVHDAGGVAVLAHPPLSVGADRAGGLEAFVERLVALGLDGLEVQHPGHTPKTRKRLRKLVRRHELLATGGSDFHGTARRGVLLGSGRGNVAVGRDCYDAILARAREIRS